MIDLTKIPDDGLRLHGRMVEMPAGCGSVLHDINWRLMVMPSSPDFFIEVEGSATMAGSCVRCLESVDTAILVDSRFLVSSDPELMVGGSHTLSRQDLDVVFYPGTTLDEEALIIEQFQLQIPALTLCSDSCKGLCHNCGSNCNNGDCVCNLEPCKPSSVLARALVGLKLNLNDADVGDRNCY